MSIYFVIARPYDLPSGEKRWRFDCPECNRQAETSPLMDWEGWRTVFCGRWGCDALLHVRWQEVTLVEAT